MSSETRPTLPVEPASGTAETVVLDKLSKPPQPGSPAPRTPVPRTEAAQTPATQTPATQTPATQVPTPRTPATQTPAPRFEASRASASSGPAWGRRERSWLWTFFAAYAAAALPWLLRALEAPLPAIAGWLLAAGLGQLLLAWLAARAFAGRALTTVRALLHTASTLILCWVWYLAGGLENPAFLLLLALPLTIAATTGATGRRRELWASAGAIVAAVLIIAWGQSSDLRWYSLRLGLPLEWAVAWAPALGDGTAPATASSTASNTATVESAPARDFVVLITFIVAILGLAAALGARVPEAATGGDSSGGGSGWRRALEAVPIGWLLVRRSDGTVVGAGKRWLRDHALAPDAVRGAALGELIAWLGGDGRDGGESEEPPRREDGEPVLYRLHGVTHAALVESAAIDLEGEPRSLLTFRRADPREALARIAGDDPWLLVDERRRAIDFGGSAARLLPDLHARVDVATLRGSDDSRPPTAGWWHPGVGEVHLGGGRYRCASYLLRGLPDHEPEQEQVFVHLRALPEAG